MSPRLERAALPKLLAHPAYRRHAKTEKFGNLASALASLVELENPPPHRDRNGSHGPTLSHNHVSVKLHHLWKCSKWKQRCAGPNPVKSTYRNVARSVPHYTYCYDFLSQCDWDIPSAKKRVMIPA